MAVAHFVGSSLLYLNDPGVSLLSTAGFMLSPRFAGSVQIFHTNCFRASFTVPLLKMLRNSGAFAATGNTQRPHAAIEMTAIDSHQFRCSRHISLGFIQLSLNELAMVSVGRFFKGGKSERGGGRFVFSVRRQISRQHLNSRVHDYDSLNRVSQLAHIARPGIVLQLFEGVCFKLFGNLSVRARKVLVKEINQRGYVLESFAQWRQLKRNDVQPIIKVGTKFSLLDLRIQSFVRCCNYAYVHFY